MRRERKSLACVTRGTICLLPPFTQFGKHGFCLLFSSLLVSSRLGSHSLRFIFVSLHLRSGLSSQLELNSTHIHLKALRSLSVLTKNEASQDYDTNQQNFELNFKRQPCSNSYFQQNLYIDPCDNLDVCHKKKSYQYLLS